MSNKTRKFNFERHIEISGYSRGDKNEDTFMESFLEAIIDNTARIIKLQHRSLKVFIDGKEI